MEPWDGPASIAFTDGTVIGAVLDRNGLRPSRYWVTDDDLVIMASEVGVLDVPPEKVVKKGRLEPGKIFLVDTTQGRIIPDDEIKAELAALLPYQEWLDAGLVHLDDLPPQFPLVPQHSSAVQQQRMFGYTQEDLRLVIAPMARNAVESLGSMGTDTPVPVISDRPRMLYEYFKQLFAQVTNPPLDANFEALVTSLNSTIGPEGNLLDARRRTRAARSCARARSSPTRSSRSCGTSTTATARSTGFRPVVVYTHYPVAEGGEGLRMAIDNVRTQVSEAIAEGANLIILSDRYADAENAPIPALLVTSAVHHHLVREKTRTRVGLVVETGEAREVHHFCLLLGYGAGAINPYLAFDTIRDLCREGVLSGLTERKAVKNYVKAAGKGILKVMSKMGISTVASYTGAQIFEAVGLAAGARRRVLHRHRVAHRGHRPRRHRARGRGAAPRSRIPTGPKSSRTASCRSAASTSGGAKASTTSSTPTRSTSCSTRPAPAGTTSSSSTRQLVDNQADAARDVARPVRAEDRRTRAGPDRRGRSRSPRS